MLRADLHDKEIKILRADLQPTPKRVLVKTQTGPLPNEKLPRVELEAIDIKARVDGALRSFSQLKGAGGARVGGSPFITAKVQD